MSVWLFFCSPEATFVFMSPMQTKSWAVRSDGSLWCRHMLFHSGVERLGDEMR